MMHEKEADGMQPYIPYNTTKLASAIRRGNWG